MTLLEEPKGGSNRIKSLIDIPFEELPSDDEDEGRRKEDHNIHVARRSAHMELKQAIVNPGDSVSIILSGRCGSGKTALIKNVLEDITSDVDGDSKAIGVFPYIIHPNIIMVCNTTLYNLQIFQWPFITLFIVYAIILILLRSLLHYCSMVFMMKIQPEILANS